MESLTIKLMSEDHAQEIVDFAVKYPKGKITAKTPDQHKVANWLNNMKQKGGWYEMSATIERLELIYTDK